MTALPNARRRTPLQARRLLPPLALCLLVGIAFVTLEVPGETRFRHALQNAGHGLAFAALAFVSLLSLGVRDTRRPAALAALVGGVSLALFVLGAAIELAQHGSGRGASGADLLMNLAGIVAGAAFALATRRGDTDPMHLPKTANRLDAGRPSRSRASRFGTDSNRLGTARFAAAALGTFALLWCLRAPIAIAVVDALAPELPTVTTFEEPFVMARLDGGSTPAALALREADARWPSNPTTALEATFPTGLWPGFRLVEPPPDWRAYRTLSMDVVNTESVPVRLHVRVDQRAAGKDIFWTASRTLEPGAHTLRIELRAMRPDVVLDPRRADHEPFAAVSQVLVFLSGNREPVTLLFDDWGLAS